MNYIVYKTTNLVNKKIYVGVHKQRTKDFDGYLGSGKWFRRSIKFHGSINFIRETLYSYTNSKEAYSKEMEIVTRDFIKSESNYNLKIGGEGGWDYINSNYNIISRRVEILRSKFGNPCGQMHGKGSQIKRLKTNTLRYGSPNAILHSNNSRIKAEMSRSSRMKAEGLCRNHYLNSETAVMKAKKTRVDNTRLRSLKKYPELSRDVSLFDPIGNLILSDILLNVSMYLFGASKGTSCRGRLLDLINGEEFNFRSKWYKYKAYFNNSSETIP